MNHSRQLSPGDLFRRLQIITTDVLALAVLAYLLWGALQALSYPYDGILGAQASGLITEIDANGSAYGQLQAGDLVLSIDGLPWEQGILDYHQIGIGNPVQIIVLRGEQRISARITLAEPPAGEMFARLSPLLIAVIFWSMGLAVHLFNKPASAARQFFLVSMVSAVFLVSGLMSSFGKLVSTDLFAFLTWMLGPLGVHLHFYFPEQILARNRRSILGILYALSFAGGLPALVRNAQKFDQIFPGWSIAGRLYLAANLTFVIALLIYAYFRSPTPGTRGKLRLIALGCVLSLLPVVILSMLPDILFGQPILGYPIAFLMLGILPLSYGYVFFRQRMARVDRRINRGVSYLLVYSILAGFVAVFMVAIHRFRWFSEQQVPLTGALVVLAVVALYSPLRRGVQKAIDKIFYGGWYDYRSATVRLTRSLEGFNNLQPLAGMLSNRLVETLRLQAAGVLLRDNRGNFSVLAIEPTTMKSAWPLANAPVLPAGSLTCFDKLGVSDRAFLLQKLHTLELPADERRLLESENVSLWVPVRSHGRLQGLLILGAKFGGDVFSREDVDILNLVARQLAPVVDNIHLLTELRSYAAGLEAKVNDRTRELHDAKQRVEAILASVGDGVIVTDLKGQILTVNDALEHTSGYQASELIGQRFDILYNSRDLSHIFQTIESSLESSQIWSGDLVARRKNGSIYDAQITTAPVRDQDRQIIGYVSSQRDITQRKELDRLKDQLILGISHNLRTPIANIYLYLDLLEDSQLKNRERAIQVLKEQSQLLKSMLENVLMLQELAIEEAEKPEFGKVDLNQLVQEAIAENLPIVEASGLQLSFEPGVDLPPIKGNPRLLALAITNLLSNAVQYTRAGEIRVRTFLDQSGACLEVLDTGMGIEAQDLPHIFEPFYRGRTVRESNQIGSGLGLAIVKEVARKHSGSISIDSQPGKGSLFSLHLPA
ncbi:MAG: PAS domain S-box protein [Anaerolineales bacterium]|nr:PAS domain S-box protein [Anaerolineales bacterium]